MRVKLRILFLILGAIFLVGLALVALRADQVGYQNLLLALPDSLGAPGQTVKRLEELAEKKFPLTYELPAAKTVKSLRSSHSVTAIGVNDSYAALMGYPLLDGSFFTAAAVDRRDRFAVLGQVAATQMFGTTAATGNTFEMDGATWLVVGVVKDIPKITDANKDSLNLYLTASCMDGAPTALMAQIDSRGEAAIRSGFKDLGIHNSSHKFISLDRVGGAMWERFHLAWKAALCGIIVLLMGWGVSLLIGRIRGYHSQLQRQYLSQVAAGNKQGLAALVGLCGLLIAGGIAILRFALNVVETAMGWKDSLTGFSALGSQWFCEKIVALQELQRWSIVLFVMFLAVLVADILTAVRKPRK